MSEKIHSLTVVLDLDFHEDDAKAIQNAIVMIKGVVSVHPHVSDINSYMAEERAREEIKHQLWETLFKKGKQ